MCKAKIQNWCHTILPTSAFFQAIIILLTLVAGGILDIWVGYLRILINNSFSQGRICLVQGWNYLHNIEGVQLWSIVLEVFVLAVVLAAVTTFIMRVNKNQRSADALREQQAEQRLIQSNEALGQSLNELTNRIDDASQNLQEINIDRKTDTNETETQDNQM